MNKFYGLLFATGVIVGWGAFVIERDKKMFNTYDHPSVCEVLSKDHPECKVK